MYLLDTNVISELRKVKTGKANPAVVRWAESVSSQLMYVSAISIMELEIGVQLKERSDLRQGRTLRFWLEQKVLPGFEGRILSVDTTIARRCAALQVPDPASYRDSLIAATALVHGMTVITRNVDDFGRVAVFNPWDTSTEK